MASKVCVKARFTDPFETTAVGIGRDARETTLAHSVETMRGATVTRRGGTGKTFGNAQGTYSVRCREQNFGTSSSAAKLGWQRWLTHEA